MKNRLIQIIILFSQHLNASTTDLEYRKMMYCIAHDAHESLKNIARLDDNIDGEAEEKKDELQYLNRLTADVEVLNALVDLRIESVIDEPLSPQEFKDEIEYEYNLLMQLLHFNMNRHDFTQKVKNAAAKKMFTLLKKRDGKKISSFEKTQILQYSSICGSRENRLKRCLDKGPTKAKNIALAALLIENGTSVRTMLQDADDAEDDKISEYLVTLAKIAKRSLLCCENGAFKAILQQNIFEQSQLDEWLLLAADAGKYDGLALLINHGADVSTKDTDGNTIFHLLAQTPYNKPIPQEVLCPLIIASGALTVENKAGNTPLSIINESAQSNVKRYLITVPLTHCLDQKYTDKGYSLLQYLLQQTPSKYPEEIKNAIALLTPFSNPRYVSDDGKTLLDFTDPETILGRIVIKNIWKRLQHSGLISHINEKQTFTQKKDLILKCIKSS